MKKQILIVDDSTSVREVVKMTLVEAGYEVIEAVDGQDGLEKLDGKKFNLIISDVNMPRMGGLEMVKSIRAMHNYKFIPIVMLTTEMSNEMKQKGKAVGAQAWMTKPFKSAELIHAVNLLTQ